MFRIETWRGRGQNPIVEIQAQEAGNTALMCASAKGNIECVKLLLDGAANKEARNDVRNLMKSRHMWSDTIDHNQSKFFVCSGL